MRGETGSSGVRELGREPVSCALFWSHNTSSHDTKAALTNCPVSLTPEQVSGLWGDDGITKAKVQPANGKVGGWGSQEGGCRFGSRG